MKVINFISY